MRGQHLTIRGEVQLRSMTIEEERQEMLWKRH